MTKNKMIALNIYLLNYANGCIVSEYNFGYWRKNGKWNKADSIIYSDTGIGLSKINQSDPKFYV